MPLDEERFYECSRSVGGYASGKYVFAPLGRLFARMLMGTPITPNQITWFWGGLMVLSSILYATGEHIPCIIGGALWIIAYALDYTDGVIAKYKDQRSSRGAYLDMIVHRVTYPLLMFCIGYGVYRTGGSDLITFDWFKDIYYVFFGVSAGISISVFMDIMPLYERYKKGERTYEDGKGSKSVEGALFRNKDMFNRLMSLNPFVFTNMMLLLLVFAMFDQMGPFIILFGTGYAFFTIVRIMLMYIDLD